MDGPYIYVTSYHNYFEGESLVCPIDIQFNFG